MRKIFHLEKKGVFHKYYSTLSALCADNPNLGVSKGTLDRFDFSKAFENNKFIIRKSVLKNSKDIENKVENNHVENYALRIKEVHDYFKSKLLSLDFEVLEKSEYRLTVLIDGNYKFVVWIGNKDIPLTRRLCEDAMSFVGLEITDEEAIEFDKKLKNKFNIKN